MGARLTQRGDHVQAQCPVHADNRASLSVGYDAGVGRTILYCHFPADEVRETLGLTWLMLYDDYEEPDDFKARRRGDREEGRAAANRRRSTGDTAPGNAPGERRATRGRTTGTASSSSSTPASAEQKASGRRVTTF